MRWIDWVNQHYFVFSWLLINLLFIPVIYFLLKKLPHRYRRSYYLPFIFFYTLSSSVFIFGIFISLGLALFLRYYKPQKRKKVLISTVDYPDYQQSPVTENSEFGEGFGLKAIVTQDTPKLIRQKMLVAINQFSSAAINKININVLTDEVDEMRLYAQTLIEKQDRAITHQIKKFTEQLEECRNPEKAAFYKKQLAQILWEQIFNYLINIESMVIVLDKIVNYAQEAFQILSDDIELPLLLAKCALRKNDYIAAVKWLNKAEENQAPAYKIASYRAEIAYIKKEYTEIKNILKNSTNKGIIGLQPVLSFWVSHD